MKGFQPLPLALLLNAGVQLSSLRDGWGDQRCKYNDWGRVMVVEVKV